MRIPGWARKAGRLLGLKGATETWTPQHPLSGVTRKSRDANVIMSPIQWIMRSLPEAEVVVERKLGQGGSWDVQDEHPLAELLRFPNPGYDGTCLFQATALSYNLAGNAYWLKRRDQFGAVRELWYIPHWMIEPRQPEDGSEYVIGYDYFPNGRVGRTFLSPDDVIHFKFGLDPDCVVKGLSPLRTLLRLANIDEETDKFSSTLLKNSGVPGLVVSPKGTGTIEKEDLEEIKRYLETSHTGENRGKPMVFESETSVKQFGFAPQQLDLTGLGDKAEERVCAALGVPAAMVGFGAGLQSTKVGATMREMRQAAWNNCIIPMQSSFASELTRKLIPDFESLSFRWRVRFDRSGVSAFQEDETAKAQRITTYVEAGILRVDEAQKMAGLRVDDSQNVYLRPNTVTAVEEGDAGIGETIPAPPAPPPTDPNAVIDEAKRALAQQPTLKVA